jgi:hypothetical protein
MKQKLIVTALICLALAIFYYLDIRVVESLTEPSFVRAPEMLLGSREVNAVPTAEVISYYKKLSYREKQKQIQIWSERYDLASEQFNQYRDITRYPHHSRPVSDAPDQIYPYARIEHSGLMRDSKNQEVDGISVKITQDRVFLNDNDSVVFTLQATKKSNSHLPITIVNSQMIASKTERSSPPPVRIDFYDIGLNMSKGVDVVAGDGIYSGRFTPKAQGFAEYRGTIRLHLTYLVDGKEGAIYQDIIYTNGSPASWEGVRDLVENGSLSIYLKVKVNTAGRYVAAGLLDDANGQPFALLRFNEELSEGDQVIKLQLFGALVHDKTPKFPLTLRDVEAFLLIPDVHPDRAMLPRRPGVVHKTGHYVLGNFSDQEWASEERDRYLGEYGRLIDTAKSHLNLLTQ